MLTALIIFAVIVAVLGIGIRILGAAVSVIFWLCVKLPLTIILGGLGLAISLFAIVIVAKVLWGVVKGLFGIRA